MFVVTLIKDAFQASGTQLTDPEPNNLARISGAPEEARDIFHKLRPKSERMEMSRDRCEALTVFKKYNLIRLCERW